MMPPLVVPPRRRFCVPARGRRAMPALEALVPAAVLAAIVATAPVDAAEPGAAAASASAPVSLDECLRAGLADNPEIAALRAEFEAAAAGRRAAESGRRPRVYGEAGWRRSDNQVIVFSDKLTAGEFTAADFGLDSLNDPDPIDHEIIAVGVDLPIDVTGTIGAGIAAARGSEGAAAARLEAATIDLTARITEAYYGVALADAAVEVARETLQHAGRHESIASARADHGDALRSELLRARAARLESEHALERRRADTALARTRLALLMGAPTRPIAATAPIPATLEEVGALEDWLARAADRSDIEAARRGSEAAGEAARAARATRGPEMAGTARYELNANGLDGGSGSYLLGLSVRWNAYDGGRGARIDEAAARAAAAAARERALADGARLEIERAWRDAGVADAALVSATEGAAAAEEARRITAERYAAGLVPLTDLLDTEKAALDLRLAALAARYDAAVARVRLRRSAGRLTPAVAAPSGTPEPAAPGATP
jgi:outer membrane protein TolC